jgi:hypothetical protein
VGVGVGVDDELGTGGGVDEELGMGMTTEEDETGGCPPSQAPKPRRHPEPQ